MKTPAIIGIALLLPFATANAATNLITNPGGEDGTTGWTVINTTTTHAYGDGAGWPTHSDPGPGAAGETSFFYGGSAQTSNMTQTIDLSFLDWGAASDYEYTASGWFGGYFNQADYAWAVVTFFDGVTNLGDLTLGPVTVGDRGNVTGLWYREQTGLVPLNADSASFVVWYQRSGTGTNDGYVDNLSFTVIPEPSAALLGSLGALALLRRRR